MATKQRGRLSLLGEALILELKEEGRLERALARFQPDDDTTYPPDGDPMASAQSRRSLPVEIH
jgi:hypothetical protein